jgi:hypothetical protein
MEQQVKTALSLVILIIGFQCQPRKSSEVDADIKSNDICTIKLYNSRFFDRDFEWIINGQKINLDKRIKTEDYQVKCHTNFDTIYFSSSKRKIKEFILCDLRKDSSYIINYNDCCSDFNFYPEGRSNKTHSIEFHLEGSSKRKLIGAVGNIQLFVAAFLKSNSNVLVRNNRGSATFPNREKIFVGDFESCGTKCDDMVIDPVTQNEIVSFVRPDNPLIEFSYVFLHNDSLRIEINSTVRVVKTNSF